MTKIKVFKLGSILSKLTIVGSLYYTVFQVNKVLGFTVLAAHLLYEGFELLLDIEAHKLANERMQGLYDMLTSGHNNSGHC